MNDAPRPLAYRALFNPGTAAALVVVAALALATSQARLIHDWAVILHPTWPTWARWLYAAGVELAILATGLVLANTGKRGLWAWEILLVAASVTIGMDVSCRCLPDLARAFVGGGLALQYLAVITAGWELVTKPLPMAAKPAAPRRSAPAPVATDAAPRQRRKPSPEDRAEWRRLAANGLSPEAIGKATGWAGATVRGALQRSET